ncbi:AbgT family transporter [Chondromyces apiculatus]|uniref:Aminobenzoyl-glutamate transport protein n=1 Tax=Chondromyces apiculatus DSM 436 TaxID=1192034 RepID=A0A017TDB9_9BACT|nr:AbgT family transporter [Chondromyces apiculatus]EYF07239.1 Aminobenzoyl-glutamate transport protein [Chondromyces apiculatus DSM 436]
MQPHASEAASPGPPVPPPRRRLADRALDAVERIGNALPDPLTLFLLLAALVVVASALAARAGVVVTHPSTGAAIGAVDLTSPDGLRRMLTEAVKNFTAFPPLGTVLVTVIGVGVAERSGLFDAALRQLVTVVPPWALTATLLFAGVNSSAAADAGIVVLPPLGAMLFAGLGRHPLAGLTAAFAGVCGGFGANVLITSLDPLLAGLTESAAQLVDPHYRVEATASYYFMNASTFLLTAVGTFVNARWVEPRFGAFTPPPAPDTASPPAPPAPSTDPPALARLAPRERRGLLVAGAVLLAYLAILAALVIPAHGFLRDPQGGFKPFFDSIVLLITLAFFLPGLAHGVTTGTIRSDRDVASMIAATLGTMGGYVALAFVAAQFVAYFSWSNLGLILAVKGAGALSRLGLTDIPLLVGFVLLSAILNLFLASASAKWAVMAAVFVPMLMLLGYSPETAQAAYRVGDAFTNAVTPLMPYFPLILAYAQRYDPRCRLGTILSATVPYSIAFGIAWTAMMVVWIVLDLPWGPGAPIHYTPARPPPALLAPGP